MGMLFGVILLVGLVRLLSYTRKPFLCAAIFSGLDLILGLFYHEPIGLVLISVGVVFVISYLYFWLLDRYDDSTILWWIILLVGMFIFFGGLRYVID